MVHQPIEDPEDLQGLNIRIGGLGGAILGKLGANARSLPASEISTSLETGRLDATELSFPLVDELLGFDKVAKHYSFPGWHQPAGFIEFYMNNDKWDALTDDQRTAIEVSCSDASLDAMGIAAGAQGPILEEFRANGVEVKCFPDSVLDALRAAADELYAEKSAEDPMFKRVIESYHAFAASYNEYQTLSSLN
ncbi:MAG: hypothetical protein AAF871_07430 [Pseudomonadota bacterium]